MAQGRVTINDVALAAGVSVSTVSRALSRPGRVNAETAKRIRLIADELGYRNETVEPFSRDQPSGLIAAFVADLRNPLFSDLAHSIQHECLRNGYGLMIVDTEEGNVLERKLASLTLPHADGFVFLSSRVSDATIRKVAQTKPVLMVNRTVRGIQSVIADCTKGIGEAVDLLAGLGHREITYLAGPEASWSESTRWQALYAKCAAARIRLRRIDGNAPTGKGGALAVDAFLANPTTAVFAYNDLMAIGFVNELRDRGVNVPGSVSVIGFDGIELGSLISPALTSVATPWREMGQQAARLLIDQVRHRSVGISRPVVLPTRLLVRETCAHAK
ncbi:MULTISPECIES: LacI family DNA-binding transcriptional regulator [Bifidobacterium]|uniref:LacI family DNA-binding transcriptional regulator n=1 Tax=Bifidobacterium TaxID=1678 RepID=UPI001BDBC8EC|nr:MULTISPECIES: LacI family DNA-binding transcriptional regulator [Bifidobacterium]MBT1162660.1 LacI family DNA-binding transcriptional regulator [Bifidobacterium sp. SO1]MBW3077947.1 LacI family DNA-binding transcriptional regulator [Bifidobacterium simiiventris]